MIKLQDKRDIKRFRKAFKDVSDIYVKIIPISPQEGKIVFSKYEADGNEISISVSTRTDFPYNKMIIMSGISSNDGIIKALFDPNGFLMECYKDNCPRLKITNDSGTVYHYSSVIFRAKSITARYDGFAFTGNEIINNVTLLA